MFGLSYKVADTPRNAIIPKRKQVFGFNFMLLKLKIVLKVSLFILNQYLHEFISTGTTALTILMLLQSFIFTFVHFITV